MIKEIKYKGITRVPSDRDSFDGELEESINITNVAGELRPYIHPEIIGSIDGDIVFVHKNSGYEHFISIKGNDIKASNYKNDEITDLGIITNIHDETFIKCEAIGNILIILTSKAVKYSVWGNHLTGGGFYKYLGVNIPFPVINFSLSEGYISPSSFSINADSYSSDLSKLRNTTASRGSGRSSRSSASIVVIEKQPFISTDLENMIKGRINSTLSRIRESKFFIFPFFLRYALRLYDGNLIEHSQPLLILPTKFIPFEAGINSSGNNVYFHFSAKKLMYSHDSIDLSDWSDIIQSVDIYISEPVYTYDQNEYINGLFENTIVDNNPSHLFGGIYKEKEDILDLIKNVSNFYKVASFTVSELSSSKYNEELSIDTIENLVNNERMNDDYLSHDTIIAENSFTYNNKLHLCGITREKFTGFSINGIDCFYAGVQGKASINIGDTPYLFYPGKCSSVILHSDAMHQGLPAHRYMNLILGEHTLLNGSFYLNPDLENITNIGAISSLPPLFAYQNMLVSEKDKLYISAHQNPFFFPAESRITIPVGRIIGMSSNTEAISQGQFGQFPLYAFTDDGVWALEISAEGKYLARQPVSREVCINPNILQMDSHIGFITEKGFTIMSGANSECITDIIRENNIRTSKIPILSFLTATGSGSFAQIYNTDNIEVFMKECSLAYEYINGKGRIFMINKNYPYSYVFDIESKSWGKIESSFSRAVNNYPDCYVQDKNGQILNLASLPVSTEQKKCLFVTRAISQSDALFLISKLAHRGVFKGGINTVIYGSRNGIDYTPVASNKNPLMAIRGTPYRYFKIAVISKMHPTDAISGCTIELIEKFTNRIR